MDWTALYLKTSGLNVFILGTGEVATRRANKFLDHGAIVTLAGNSIDEELSKKGAELHSTDKADELVGWADLVVIASRDRDLSNHVADISKDKLLNRADFPNDGDIIVPTSFNSIKEEEWKERGANIIIYANQLMRAEVPAMQKAAETILENHRAEECDSMLMPFKDIIRLIPAEG